MGQGIREEAIITDDKRLQSGQDLGERRENEQREEDSKSSGREKFFDEIVAAA